MAYGNIYADTLTNSNGQTGNAIGPGFKNRIINGAMMIDQRNAGAAVTTSTSYPVDRFFVVNSTDGAFSAQQNSSAPAGFINSLKVTTTTADASLTTTQQLAVSHRIEGTNIADLAWGSASAKTVTLSFWVRSSLTGTFGGSLRNSDSDRSYPFTYTINAADTWENKSITIAGDTTGTWLTTTGRGIEITFGLGVGPDRSGTASSWAAANYASATSATSVIGTLNATWYITGVQLEVGTSATSFDYRPYGTELQLCQRYYAKIGAGGFSNYNGMAVGYVASATVVTGIVTYPTTMRGAATINYSNVRVDAGAGGANAVSSITSVYAGTNTLMANFNATGSTLTTGQAGLVIANNNSAGYLDLSAEL